MYVSQEVWRLANPDFDQHINEGTSAQSSYHLPALSPSVCQPHPSRCCSNNPILSWQSLAGRKEMKAKQAFSSWRKKILFRNLCISLARIGSHGSPLDQSKGSEVPHLDSGPSWFFPSNWALATQTQVGFYSEGRRIAVEGATAPKSLFPALTTLSSNCTFPTAWSTYLIVLLPQTQSFSEKNSFSHLIGGSFFCISRLFQWQFHPSTHHRGCDPQNHFRCPLGLDFLIQLVPRAAESSSS